MPNTVPFFDTEIRLADEASEWALMEFAEAAQSEEDNTLQGLAAVMALLKDSISPDDWDLFKATARKNKASAKDCMAVVFAVYEQATERPTGRPSDSSDGPVFTSQSSADGGSAQVIERLEAKGRPDLALVVLQAQEARTASRSA